MAEVVVDLEDPDPEMPELEDADPEMLDLVDAQPQPVHPAWKWVVLVGLILILTSSTLIMHGYSYHYICTDHEIQTLVCSQASLLMLHAGVALVIFVLFPWVQLCWWQCDDKLRTLAHANYTHLLSSLQQCWTHSRTVLSVFRYGGFKTSIKIIKKAVRTKRTNKSILLLSIIPLILASLIMGKYIKTYYPSCSGKLTAQCSWINGSFAVSLFTALAISLSPLPEFRWLQHIWLLRRGHPGRRFMSFILGVLACVPVNFVRPLTNTAVFGGLLMVLWAFKVDLGTDVDYGLSSTICGVLVGIGIIPFIPKEIPSPRKNDDVKWLVGVGLALGLIFSFTIDWIKRILGVLGPVQQQPRDFLVEMATLNDTLQTTRSKRLEKCTQSSSAFEEKERAQEEYNELTAEYVRLRVHYDRTYGSLNEKVERLTAEHQVARRELNALKRHYKKCLI